MENINMDSQPTEKLVNISVRVSNNQKRLIEYAMRRLGFTSLNAFLLNSTIERSRRLLNENKIQSKATPSELVV